MPNCIFYLFMFSLSLKIINFYIYYYDLISDVNIQLQLLYTWLSCNKLSLNINKTSYTIFRPHSNTHINIRNSLHINHEAIKSSEESTKAGAAQFLGVYIDNHLTFSQHIDHLCTSLSKSIFAINRVKYLLPYAALRSLYFCLIHSRLQYAIEAWGNSNSLHKLQRVQKRAIRVINNTNSDIIQILYLKEITF